MKSFKTLFTALLLLCCTVTTAHDFEVDGIYYNILSEEDKTVEVTYRGSSYDSYSNEYSGDATIPANVTYNSTSYSVTTIGSRAFHNCSSLTSITIPNSVTSIGISAFNGCSSLASIEIPSSVTKIEESPFTFCNKLASITVDINNPVYDSRNNCNAIIETASNTLIAGCKNTKITNSVTKIGTMAFNGCTDLTCIEIPNSVTEIGWASFAACTSLANVKIPNSVTKFDDYVFSHCNCLTSIEIPNSVTTIGWNAFDGCENLTKIEIPNSVTTIGRYAFERCTNLTSITVNENNPAYDSRDNCNAIIETASNTLVVGCKNTIIPNSVTTIGYSAFYACSGLTSIEIPNSVTTIGDYAFGSCSSLTSITSLIPADKLFSIDSSVFNGVDKNACTIYVPYGAKETYAATDGWNEFTNIVELAAEQFELTVSAAGYATLYLDYNANIPNGVEVYTANTVKGDRLMLQQVNGVLPANTGVIARAEKGTYTFAQSDEEEVDAIESNLLRGSIEDEYITPKKGFAYYVLSMKNGIVGMYKDELTGGTFKNNANKAYLVLTDITVNDEEVDTQTPGAQLSNSYYFDFGGTTAIDEVATGVNDNVYYDLSGRRVENPTRGIYIRGGKKVFVK